MPPITECPNCGGSLLQWHAAVRGPSDVVDGRIRMSETSVHAYLACEECSETLGFMEEAEINARLNAGLPTTDKVAMVFDEEEACGVVTLVRGSSGPTLVVDGREIGYIDLFPPTDGNPVQILFFAEGPEEPLAKILLDKRMIVVVHKDAVPVQTEHTIFNQGDRVLAFPEKPDE